MLRDLSMARAASCGRCGAEIPEGFFCESCHSFFSRLARASLEGDAAAQGRRSRPRLPRDVSCRDGCKGLEVIHEHHGRTKNICS